MFNKCLYVLPFVCICFIFSIKARAETDLSQLHSDQVFEKARSYDPELNGGLPGDQLLAEKYYLEFLTRTSHWKAQSWTYCKLGVLFSTNFDSKCGEKADYQKADKYFTKCIEMAGDRVTRCVVRARSMMISPLYSTEQRYQMRMDFCRWLLGLKTADLTERWHYQSDKNLEIEAQDVQKGIVAFKKRLELLLESHQNNMVYDAVNMNNPKVFLNQIIEIFPKTSAAKLAQKMLNEILAEETGK